jgi:DNA polymerase-3 subunit epsilon
MKLNLTKPLVFFDLETTGINVTQDRIVEAAFLKVHPNGKEEVVSIKVNPTIPIPSESSMIHGIYDADVANEPTFKEVAKDIFDFLKGCDLAGYNLVRFDVPVLTEEFLRVDLDFSITNRKLVDAQKIFYLMEPRTLTAAYKYYCGGKLNNAHSAEADTLATYEVLKAQVARYQGEEVEDANGNLTVPIQNDMQTLHNLSRSQSADLAGRFGYNSEGVPTFNFGKHKGKPVKEVLRIEPMYYDWMMRGDFPLETKKVLTEIRIKMMSER